MLDIRTGAIFLHEVWCIAGQTDRNTVATLLLVLRPAGRTARDKPSTQLASAPQTHMATRGIHPFYGGPMEQQSSHRRAVAAALATLIRQRLGAARTSTILRTALHSSVPVSERPDVRRGVDGLVANGVLAQTGEYIGFTAKGRLYLAHLRGAQLDRRASPRHDMDEADAAAIVNLLRKIDEDEHFEPYGKAEAVESLPARLEAQMAARRPQPGKIKWILLAFLLVLVVALFALRH